MSPERIGPYRIERELGAGGMGTVYYGVHETTGQPAAVKMLPAAMAREPGFVARFNREMDAMRTVSGPNIVALYEGGEADGSYYYAMEYIEGETLTDRLHRDKRIPWREAIQIAVQICKALKSAHNAGVIHRDLKPSNLMLRTDGVVKLTDFGVAQMFATGKLTATGGVIGTVEYMSPEQAQGKRATKQSDIYALGAVMYVMLTGRPPFTGKTALDIAQKHRFGQFDSPRRIVPDIPHWLDEIVCNCLQKKPEDRYPDAYVLQLRLQEVPRKVELSKSSPGTTPGVGADDPTGAFQIDGAAANDETQPADVDPRAANVGGTLMRDLVRDHVQRTHAMTPLERAFDNTWALVGLLAALILAGVWWVQSRSVDPEELFARGEQLMSKSPGAAWDEARRNCFLPLLEIDREAWGPKVDGYLERIAVHDLGREFLGTRAGRSEQQPRTDVVRFLRRALDQKKAGETAQARRTLNALRELLAGQNPAPAELALVEELLEALPAAAIAPLAEQTFERAAELAADGRHEDARRLWSSLLTLYAEDPDAAAVIARTRKAIESLPPEGSTNSTTGRGSPGRSE